jgi:hypothetical protein
MSEAFMQNEAGQEEEQAFPPRSEVHKEREKKASKFKIKYGFIRLLVILFILLPGAVFYFTKRYLEEQKWKEQHLRFETKQFEEIFIEANRKKTNERRDGFVFGPYLPHKVRQGETLQEIAEKYALGSDGEEILRKYNKIKSSAIKPGETIKIPVLSFIK